MLIQPNEMSLLFSMREVFSRAREMSLYTPVAGKGLLAIIGEGVALGLIGPRGSVVTAAEVIVSVAGRCCRTTPHICQDCA